MKQLRSITRKIIWPKAGTYIVAVSGGVDSVVLLDLLVNHVSSQLRAPSYEVVVVHFDHGMRTDSAQDAMFVGNLAKTYGLKFELGQGNLGARASEATARQARYEFLESVRQRHKADAIITAHHLDDKVETAILNIQRGSGRQGFTPFRRPSLVIRPLKNVYKQQLVEYAKTRGLTWHIDSTNYDLHLRRNYIRHVVLPALEAQQADFKDWLVKQIRQIEFENFQIDQDLEDIKTRISSQTNDGLVIKRAPLIMMNQRVIQEFLHYVINQVKPGADISAQQIKRFVHFCKTARPKARLQLNKQLQAHAGYDRVTLTYHPGR